jgi:hypothetical protein
MTRERVAILQHAAVRQHAEADYIEDLAAGRPAVVPAHLSMGDAAELLAIVGIEVDVECVCGVVVPHGSSNHECLVEGR